MRHACVVLAYCLAPVLLAQTAQADRGEGNYFGHFGMMGTGGWFYGPFMMLIFFGLLVGAVVLVVRVLNGRDFRPGQSSSDRARDILRERFAKGEITKEEFEDAQKVLQ